MEKDSTEEKDNNNNNTQNKVTKLYKYLISF